MILSLYTAIAELFLPSALAGPVLRLVGHRVARRSRIGFSLVMVDRLYIARESSIRLFNLLHCRRIVRRTGAQARTGASNLGSCPIALGGAFEDRRIACGGLYAKRGLW
jgi:hypothetical protein